MNGLLKHPVDLELYIWTLFWGNLDERENCLLR